MEKNINLRIYFVVRGSIKTFLTDDVNSYIQKTVQRCEY